MKLENPFGAGIRPRDLLAAAGRDACWRFERFAGEVITHSLQLAVDGSLVGHDHANEARWHVGPDGALHLITADGEVSSVFDGVELSSGPPRLLGRFVLDGSSVPHTLVQTRLPPAAPRRPAPAAPGKREAEIGRGLEQFLFGASDSMDVLRMAKFDAALTSARYYQQQMLTATNLPDAEALLTFAADHLGVDGLVLEFGVASGLTVSHIARHFRQQRVYGFDVFTGLPEAWRTGFERGAFGRSDLPPVEPNVELVVGLFEDTLPAFAAAHPGPVALLHVDCDLYSSTVTILDHLGDRLQAGSVVVFDEYFNYPGWQEHEFRAWREFCERSGMRYEYLGFVSAHQQVAVRCLGRG
jgi:predicted O-methyltransferase YrrM